MGAFLQGSKHSSVLRGELAILEAIRVSPNVKKVEPLWIEWTGSHRRRLRLKPSRVSGGVLEGWLYLEARKRFFLIFPETGVKLEKLCEGLERCLARFRIQVETAGKRGGELTMEQYKQNGPSASLNEMLTREELLSWGELIADQVKKIKEIEEEESLLELQLDDVRKKKAECENEELNLFTKLLEATHQGAKCAVS